MLYSSYHLSIYHPLHGRVKLFGHQPVQKEVLIFSPVEKQSNINLIINAFAILDIKCHIKTEY